MNRKSSRALRGLGILTITAALTFGAPTAVVDARTVFGVIKTQVVTDINANQTVNLTVIKTAENPFDEEVKPEDVVVSGITFTIMRLSGVDLTTESGWATARDISIAQAQAHEYSGTYSAVTNAEGEVTFNNLPIGLYLVHETPLTTPGPEDLQIVDFLITLPTGDNDGLNWDYDVQVNSKSEAALPATPTKPTTPNSTITRPSSTTTRTQSALPQVPTSPAPTQIALAQTPTREAGQQGLASTGANVLGMLGFALLLIGVGFFLVMRSRKH
ncbi:pilin N-terminal domain-containing protein [Corynebacterium callunae]|uniref:pilin N-terminal domain-containing protein n=1 Tax=Corynebacterium callunae TaxID=1721 RepID=UPI003981C668